MDVYGFARQNHLDSLGCVDSERRSGMIFFLVGLSGFVTIHEVNRS